MQQILSNKFDLKKLNCFLHIMRQKVMYHHVKKLKLSLDLFRKASIVNRQELNFAKFSHESYRNLSLKNNFTSVRSRL